MVARAPKPCNAPSCPKLCRDTSGYCEGHQELTSNWSKTRGTSSQRGYGSKWRKTRVRVMARDKALCQPCLKQSRYTQATEVDHIIPKSIGGDDNPDNLQAICRTCHQAKTRRDRGG